jgi:hypothetical protein
MKAYTFFKHKGHGRIPGFDLEEFSSERDAVSHARWMLNDDPLNTAIDIWDGFSATLVTRRPPCLQGLAG